MFELSSDRRIAAMTREELSAGTVLMRLYNGLVLRYQFEMPQRCGQSNTRRPPPKFRCQFRFKAAFTPSARRRTGGDGKTNPSRALTVQRLQSRRWLPGE
jgi:hypothetical protein